MLRVSISSCCVIMPAEGFDLCNDRGLLCEERRSLIVSVLRKKELKSRQEGSGGPL